MSAADRLIGADMPQALPYSSKERKETRAKGRREEPRCGCFGSRLATVLKENHLCRGIFVIIEPECTVASGVISAHTATRAPAVHLMNTEPVPPIEGAPGFHQNSSIHL